MRLLQRYILFDLLRIFGFLLSGLTVLLVFVGVFREVNESGLGPVQALEILPFVVPSLLPFTIPATLLLTVCVVYGRMAGDQEVTAAKAAGINVLSLLWPSFVLAAVLSLCSLVLADRVIPWAVANIQRTVSLAMEDIFLDVLRSRGQLVDEDRGFSITVMGVEGKTLIRPTFHYQPRNNRPATLQAERATVAFDLENQEIDLHLVRGHIDVPGQHHSWLVTEDVSLPLPYEAKEPKPRHQSIRTIRHELARLTRLLEKSRRRRDVETAMALALGDFDRIGQLDMHEYEQQQHVYRTDLSKLRTEVHSRFALATSCFFFVLAGAPFAIMQARRQFLTTFFMCFLPVLLIYYPVVLLLLNLSKHGMAPPWALWGANVLLAIVACFTLRSVLKH